MRIPDWTSYGFASLKGFPIFVASLEAWGKLLALERCPLQLPLFQRGTAWNEVRVELFWDSLARGYPIGTLLLSTADVKSRPLPDAHYQGSTRQTSATYEALIIDGQQRCVALKLGFRDRRPGDTSRLWLDLVSASHFFEGAQHSQDANPFRLCSGANPWGKPQGERPRLSQRRRARKVIGHNEFYDNGLSLERTFPLSQPTQSPPLPVPVSNILELVLNREDVSVVECLALIPDGALIMQENDTQLATSVTKEQRAELELKAIARLDTEQLKKFLHHLRERLRDPLIACFSAQLQKGDDLIEAFVRMNRQGVALSEAELFFSGLKHEWGEANDLVDKIATDTNLGHMLEATEIVHAAVRLALSKDPEKDVPRLTVEEFRRLLRTDSDRTKSLLADLSTQLRIKDGTTRARLHDLLLRSRDILAYRHEVNDPGLPKPLLATLRWRIWHVLLAWLDRHDPTKDVIEKSRFEVLRFVLLDHLFLESDGADVIRKPFLQARKTSPESLFPGREIFSDLKGYLSPGLLRPVDYQKIVERPDSPWGILRDEWALVLWAQREWLDRWFPNFNPAAPHVADDLPYDIDHIMPSNFFDGRGVGNRIAKEVAADFGKNKNALRESIGNKRAWPREANRRDQDEAPTSKLFLNQNSKEHFPEDHFLTAWKLKTVGAVWQASLVPEYEVELWRKASGTSNGDWTDPERFEAFREAVNSRRIRLYKTFFQELGYENWLHSDEMPGSEESQRPPV